MKQILLTIIATGALTIALAQATTNHTDIHDISNSKSNITLKYVDIHEIKYSQSKLFVNNK